jgi:hypothetical protein
MGIGRVVVCLGVTGGLWAQGGRRPPVPRPVREGCPAVVPPSDNSTVATAADFIELKRTACAEGCPAYTVRIGGDGRVDWVGERFVEMKGSAAAVIDVIPARELMERVSGQGFGMFCTRYSQAGAVDGASTSITLSIAGRVKRVQDVGGAAPPLLRSMADDIDRVGDTHKWRHGEPMQETFGDDHLVVDIVSPKAGVTRLMRAAGQPDMSGLENMVADTSLNLNAVDSSGWTALMYAAQAGPPEAVAILLKARAKAEIRSYEGETAMFAAASSTQHADAKVRMLAAVGVDVNGQDNRGVTPLMIAARHSRVPGLISSLIQLGADPTKRDVEGKTALDYLMEAEVRSGVRDSAGRGLLGGK